MSQHFLDLLRITIFCATAVAGQKMVATDSSNFVVILLFLKGERPLALKLFTKDFIMNNTKKIKLPADVKAIRRARELCGVTRNELGLKLGISNKTIEKIENGRMNLSPERLSEILEALNLKKSDLTRVKKGKGLLKPKRELIVTSNNLRRSYKKLITKECRVLKSMRKQKGFSQDHASFLCGYSRPSIGHIENGRIELSNERIRHIIESYGYKYKDFENNLNQEELRDQIIETCIDKINQLDDSKLGLVKNLLGSF